MGCGASANILKPLITQHKRTIRTIADANYRDHTDPLFKRFNILKIEDIYKLNLLMHVHKGHSKGDFHTQHEVNTRNSNFANPTFHRLSQTQRAVSYAGPRTWNDLPEDIRSTQKYTKFKYEVKRLFISRYGN